MGRTVTTSCTSVANHVVHCATIDTQGITVLPVHPCPHNQVGPQYPARSTKFGGQPYQSTQHAILISYLEIWRLVTAFNRAESNSDTQFIKVMYYPTSI